MNTGWYVEGGMGPMAKPHQWIHACNVYDASTKEYKLFFNGEQIPLEKITRQNFLDRYSQSFENSNLKDFAVPSFFQLSYIF